MKTSGTTLRIGIAAATIVGTIGWLAISGYGASKSYYVTVAELGRMGDKAYTSRLRVDPYAKMERLGVAMFPPPSRRSEAAVASD